jgi:tripartite-type tricarboxylate transporter receptor subunit TctC
MATSVAILTHNALMKRRNLAACIAALPFVIVPLAAKAQSYPSKPIRLIVPFLAGGATDILARALSGKLAEKLDQSIMIDNRPGAGGSIGSDAVAKSAPDGYTLLLATSSTHSIGPALNPKLPFDASADFTPLGYVATSPNIVLVPNSSPAKTITQFIDYAKKNPGKLNYASTGNGTIVHLTSELFKVMSDTYIVHIPYRGTALAIPDLISGKVDVMFDSLVTGLPYVKDGKLRALAVTSAARTSLAGDLPAVAEVLPGFESTTWFGLYGPKGLSAEVVQRINTALNAALTDPEVKERFARLGAEPTGGSAPRFAQVVKADHDKWKAVIAQRKVVIE